MNKFWNFIRNDAGERILRLDGAISDSTWFEDDVTPAKFREELNSSDGNISVWINSPGGDCFAASQIYNMLMDYRGGSVTVKIDGIAASAASVIAMAGETVEISPTGMIMIHNPSTFAWGDADEMKAAIKMLDEVKESIINAYEIKTSLPRDKISRLMDAETWLSAHKAIELGFADKILFAENHTEDDFSAMAFSRMTVTNSLLDKIKRKKKAAPDNRVDAAQLNKRLTLIR
ncbi:MAG: Clp protease ClpP [Selenomonadaceae bacterium]|nr:Clp protease ClpP [Selenomonadaceae bacterium]MBR4384749.1 Clp protease ClpP [Selenomonadaceae bacterium]